MARKALLIQLVSLILIVIPGSLGVYFQLGIPDLIATKRTKDGDVTIKGYQALTNEALLATNSTEIASKLLWATVGEPRIVKSGGGGNISAKVFHFTDSGFYMMMQLKTAEDSELLAKRAALKYGLPIAPAQIRHLMLSKLNCVLDLRDTERRSVRIVGRPTSLKNFPLKVEFRAPPGSESRSLFEKRLADDPDMSVPCSMCLSSTSEDDSGTVGNDTKTNVTESTVLTVPGGGGGGRPEDDCRRRQVSQDSVVTELTLVAGNLSALICDANRLTDWGWGSPALTTAIDRVRAVCARLGPPQSLLAANLTDLLARLAAVSASSELRHRLALRAVYNLRNGRTHNLLDSRRLRARPAAGGQMGPDGARFRPSGSGGALLVDDSGEELTGLMDAASSWTFFAKLLLDADQPLSAPPQPLITFRDPAEGRSALLQLLVGPSQVATVLANGRRIATPTDLRPGVWHRVATAAAPQAGSSPAVVVHVVDGVASLAAGDPTVSDVAAEVVLPTDRRRLWLGEGPAGGSAGGISGVVGCFGAAAAALTPAEIEAVFAAYCD